MTRYFVVYKGTVVAGPFIGLSNAQTAKNEWEIENRLYGQCNIIQK